jgi:hypothetical protein
MANTKFDDHISDDFDPYRWGCSSCGKEREYTQREIDKLKQPYPDPHNHPADFSASCPFCGTGVMEPPGFVSFGGVFEDFDDD